MQITEPTTMVTDYILAGLAGYFATKLWRLGSREQQNSVKLWSSAFFATTLAAVVGGTSHGFALYLNSVAQVVIWKTTVYVIGLASFFMLIGTILASVSGTLRKGLFAAAGLQLVVYAVWMIAHDAFKYVIFDYVPAMLAVILLQTFALYTKKDKSAPWIIAGILVSFGAAGIQLSGFTLHQHFNYNDLYHVIQMGAIYLLYNGVCLMQDQSVITINMD